MLSYQRLFIERLCALFWIHAPPTQIIILLCTYQCKSRVGGVRARGGDLMPGTIPAVGLLIV